MRLSVALGKYCRQSEEMEFARALGANTTLLNIRFVSFAIDRNDYHNNLWDVQLLDWIMLQYKLMIDDDNVTGKCGVIIKN